MVGSCSFCCCLHGMLSYGEGVLYQWHTLESSTHGQKVLWSCVSSLCFEGRNVCIVWFAPGPSSTELLWHFQATPLALSKPVFSHMMGKPELRLCSQTDSFRAKHLCSALILFSHCWKVDKTKPSILSFLKLFRTAVEYSSITLLHKWYPTRFSFSIFWYWKWGIFPRFFSSKAKFKIEKNGKKKIQNFLTDL